MLLSWCGTLSAHCSSTPTTPTGTPPSPIGGSGTVSSPARTLFLQDVQAGIDRYNQLQGGSERATQDLVNTINDVTKSYTLFRQLTYVAQTIFGVRRVQV
jgi:hypothetical protein